ncbi:MAG: hypothetical protein ACOYKZ_03585 [Chlamydiia bacterium]
MRNRLFLWPLFLISLASVAECSGSAEPLPRDYRQTGRYVEGGMVAPLICAPYLRAGYVVPMGPNSIWDIAGNCTFRTNSLSLSNSWRRSWSRFSIGPELNVGIMLGGECRLPRPMTPYLDVGVRAVFCLDQGLCLTGGLYVIPVPFSNSPFVIPLPMASVGLAYYF